MLQVYYILITYRLDLVVLALLVTGACLLLTRFVRRRGPAYRPPWKSFGAAGLIVVLGGFFAEWAASVRVQELQRLFAGFGPTYATELALQGHDRITLQTPNDDPRYLEIIAHEKAWLAANPIVADIYTFRQDAEERIRLIVDSETDYDRDGVISGAREERTRIGEAYEEATPSFYRALAGETVFESEIMPDRWGVWVSSFTPIYGPDGKVDAAVGIDYPADTWLVAIAGIRAACLGLALVLNIILLTSSTFIAFLAAEIEQRKATQRRLEQASESAFSASASKSEFLALMSHEVRTPLSAILGFAQVLADTKLDARQARYIDTINRAGATLLELLNHILDYTRVENGKLKLERIAWTPALLVHEVMELMSVHADQKKLQLNFDNHLPGGLTLFGDPTRIRQILLNLVTNAVKFTEAGSVTVRAEWKPTGTARDGRLVLDITDTGVGIPADKIPQLFQAFTQADASTTRQHGGTGLGLAICKRLSDLMAAKIQLRSTPNAGTTFTLELATESIAAAAASPTASVTAGPVPVWARALVIDDTKLNRELLKVMLRRLGLEADVAASGAEGVALAAGRHYEIIFMDLEMPEMDGFATTRAIRAAEPAGQHTPILAVSAMTATGTREKCLAAGMDDYLTKPVYLPALKSATDAYLTQRAGAPSAPKQKQDQALVAAT